MALENKAVIQTADDFLNLETFKIHKTRYSEVFAEVVTIKNKLYVGLQRKCYCERFSDPRTKSIYFPVEVLATLQRQPGESIEKLITEQNSMRTARTE